MKEDLLDYIFTQQESDSKPFRIMNNFRGQIHGKNIFSAQKMALEYVEKHLGKRIEITQCDWQELEKAKSRAEKLNDLLTHIVDKYGHHFDKTILKQAEKIVDADEDVQHIYRLYTEVQKENTELKQRLAEINNRGPHNVNRS